MAALARRARELFRDDRGVLALFGAFALVVAFFPRFTIPPNSRDWPTALLGGFGLNIGELLAAAAMVMLLARLGTGLRLRPLDHAALAVASLCMALPLEKLALAAVSGAALVLAFSRDRQTARIGQLLLALTAFELWGPIAFKVVAPWLLSAETDAVVALLGLQAPVSQVGQVIMQPSGHGIIIENSCSAFHNLSLATLCWMALVAISDAPFGKREWGLLACLAVATVAINTVRIALMAQSMVLYEYWHNGTGAFLCAVALALAVMASFLALPRGKPLPA